MAKRRRKKPNLPQDVLARARQQAGLEEEPQSTPEDAPAETADTGSDDDESAAATNAASVNERAARRRKTTTVQLERSRQRGELTTEMMQDLLHNPTKDVSEEELAQEYQHVLVDLRNMGILAAILISFLIVLTFTL